MKLVNPTIKMQNNNFEDGGNNKPNETVDESYASINADVFDDIVLYEDPNDDDIANEIKRKRNEEILANRRRKHERIAQREIREALKKAAVSNENADLLECKASATWRERVPKWPCKRYRD